MILTDPQLDALVEMIADRVAERLKIQLAQKWVTREEYAQQLKLLFFLLVKAVAQAHLKVTLDVFVAHVLDLRPPKAR